MSTPVLLLDSSALVAWILQQPGRWQPIQALLTNQGVGKVIAAPALTEIICTSRRKGNVSSPTQLQQVITAYVDIEPVLAQDALLAVSLQEDSNAAGDTYPDGSPATLSLGDSLILAVAARLGVPVVTFDRHWGYLFSKALLPSSIPTIVVP